MAYDEILDERVSSIASEWGAERKRMFGGTGYMLNGNMMAGVHGDRLVLRLDPEVGAAALKGEDVRPFDMVPRPMPGWVTVGQTGLQGTKLREWLEQARTYAGSLPGK